METQTVKRPKSIKINWSISTRSLYSILILLFLTPFTILNFMYVFVPGFEDISNIEGKFDIEDIGYFWIPMLAYALIAFNVYLLTRVFTSLRSYKVSGLLRSIFIGFATIFLLEIVLVLLEWYSSFIFGFGGAIISALGLGFYSEFKEETV